MRFPSAEFLIVRNLPVPWVPLRECPFPLVYLSLLESPRLAITPGTGYCPRPTRPHRPLEPRHQAVVNVLLLLYPTNHFVPISSVRSERPGSRPGHVIAKHSRNQNAHPLRLPNIDHLCEIPRLVKKCDIGSLSWTLKMYENDQGIRPSGVRDGSAVEEYVPEDATEGDHRTDQEV
jgi:hypothetical protein